MTCLRVLYPQSPCARRGHEVASMRTVTMGTPTPLVTAPPTTCSVSAISHPSSGTGAGSHTKCISARTSKGPLSTRNLHSVCTRPPTAGREYHRHLCNSAGKLERHTIAFGAFVGFGTAHVPLVTRKWAQEQDSSITGHRLSKTKHNARHTTGLLWSPLPHGPPPCPCMHLRHAHTHPHTRRMNIHIHHACTVHIDFGTRPFILYNTT